MSVALAGRSPRTFDIKSASLPLLALRLKSPDIDLLADELLAQYGEMPDFFEDDGVVLDLSTLANDQGDAEIDFQRVGELLHERRLRLLAVRGGSPAQQDAARAIGLLLAPDTRVQTAARVDEPADPTSGKPAAPVAAPDLPAPGALVIDRPLRSGQQVYARGRDLVVLAMVNHGAEVVADGHIHIYAPLRGRALAGARGWSEACIFAREMRPDLVSIAGVYRTSEEPLPDTVWGQAAMVRLASTDAGDKLIFDPIAG
ncbi:septum site-determining protein MinC [Ottowia sp. SB7-C50]|uniref:septum site-determining protein MinC n=1 Tax=Ottowia sp. SB7-C50 TaxID=3081231 RepID=UPI002953DBFD|nr:septum site-determining protein MinC [Ottowia sp. SB7-C50]WOP15583.1 septum site-determining protein MinC [Ottowia sp. SB7-C50]